MFFFLTVLLTFAIVFLPESPTWLNGTQRDERAKRATKWLKLERRGTGEELQDLHTVEQPKVIIV